MAVDLVFRDVRILDGTGAPAFEGDVAVEGGRIAAVGGVGSPPRTATVIDGNGRVLAPGFVDTHTHDDGALVAHPGLEFKVAQGCTSLVIGNCGFSTVPAGGPGLWATRDQSWGDLDGFRAALEAGGGIAANAIALIGHNTMRAVAMGDDAKRTPTPAELATMRGWVEQAIEQGACGVSTGLIYRPGRWSDAEEVAALARAAGDAGGLYATHLRNEADRLLDAVDEAISIGRAAGCGVHISHHKAAGPANWGKVRDSLELVDAANDAGADVTLDVYPYTAGSGRMIEYFNLSAPDEALAEVVRLASCPAFPDYEGRMLVDIAGETGETLAALVVRILTAERGDRTICIHFLLDEADIETNLRHPRMMVGSDGIPDLRGKPHPRLFGTMPRVLGEYVRRRGVLSLEEAVRRMTSLSADRFGLEGRGRVAEGLHADLVLFDPDAVADTATYDEPMREPVGIDCVVVNGAVVYAGGAHTGARPGRLLRYRDGESGRG
ncbi:MAG TPA: D-aminoacylase [Acidimicrobiales bacterium]|nr:D-aminoacylase [Acidimicrobiales bacterium]